VETLNLQESPIGPDRDSAVPGGTGRFCLVRKRGRLYFAVLLTIYGFFNVASSNAQQARPTESQVKAAYLFNFGKFVHWPVASLSQTDSLEICVLGKNPFGSVLDATVKGETIGGKSVTSRTVPSLRDGAACNIVYVSMSEEGRLSSILSEAKQLSALTVSDIPHFAQRGGMIEFVNQEGRIRFEVNAAALVEARLTVSSELLKVAVKVTDKRAGGD